MEQLCFDDLLQEMTDYIAKNKFMALATFANDMPTVRMVSIISQGLSISFMTLKTTTKFDQFQKAPHIAGCIGNMQYEGLAEIDCSPAQDVLFSENYKSSHENTYRIYADMQDSIIIKIKPQRISFWRYDEISGAHKDYLDIIKQEAYREFY